MTQQSGALGGPRTDLSTVDSPLPFASLISEVFGSWPFPSGDQFGLQVQSKQGRKKRRQGRGTHAIINVATPAFVFISSIERLSPMTTALSPLSPRSPSTDAQVPLHRQSTLELELERRLEADWQRIRRQSFPRRVARRVLTRAALVLIGMERFLDK